MGGGFGGRKLVEALEPTNDVQQRVVSLLFEFTLVNVSCEMLHPRMLHLFSLFTSAITALLSMQVVWFLIFFL